MNIIGWSPSNSKINNVKNVNSMIDVFRNSEFKSVQILLSKHTKSLIKKNILKEMKPGAIFASVSRSDIVDEKYLYHLIEKIYKRLLFGRC